MKTGSYHSYYNKMTAGRSIFKGNLAVDYRVNCIRDMHCIYKRSCRGNDAVQAGGNTVNRNEIKGTVGSLKISDEVICAIAGSAAKEIKGVYSLAPCPVDIKKGFPFKSLNKDKFVKVQVSDAVAVLDVYLILEFGAKILEVSEAVQKNVKAAVQNMASITVSKVNVHIVSVHMDETTLSEQ